jgi:hypothetical protein
MLALWYFQRSVLGYTPLIVRAIKVLLMWNGEAKWLSGFGIVSAVSLR